MRKASPAQAKMIARIWSDFRPLRNVMTKGRNGDAAYLDPTMTACIKRGWIAPTEAAIEFYENNCTYLPHEITDAGFLALEQFLRDERLDKRAGRPVTEQPTATPAAAT